MVHRRHRKHFSKRSSKNIVNKSLSLVKSTSKKIIPKVTSSVKNVGSKVVNNGVPFLQRMTRKFFGILSNKSKKHRRH
jgi:hypothetical protein